MSQFYTKVQIDQIATVIGNEIKQTKSNAPTPAESYNSFIDAFNAALNSPGNGPNIPVDIPGSIITNTGNVVIGSRIGTQNYKYSINVNGDMYNSEGLSLIDFWNANRLEFDVPAQDLFISRDLESNGMVFSNNSYDTDLRIILKPVGGSPNDYEFLSGSGNSINGTIEFVIAPSNTAS